MPRTNHGMWVRRDDNSSSGQSNKKKSYKHTRHDLKNVEKKNITKNINFG